MSFNASWTHRHVFHETRQMVTGFNNQLSVFHNYRQIMFANCPFGPNCQTFRNQIGFWPPYPINTIMGVNRPLGAQFSPHLPIQGHLPHVFLSNDIFEFNDATVPLRLLVPNPVRTEINSLETNRKWEHVAQERQLDSSKTMRFKLMNYNVLSQTILDSKKAIYNSCREENLVWEARWERIFNEVLTLDPDIFCLQEVQASHLQYYASFRSVGYLGVFKKKTRYKADGCAVFYKESVFAMIDKVAVEYRCEEIPALRADSVGVIVKLAPLASPNTLLVVATTHLLYMPDEAATRLAQMRILINEIEKFSYDETRGFLPLILTGDFNAMPNSNVIKFLQEGQIIIRLDESLEHIGFSETEVGTNFELQRVGMETDGINVFNGDTMTPANPMQVYKLASHSLNLSSVYDIDNGNPRWESVDHIYFSNTDLAVIERLSPPATCMRRRIPNEIYGSDHMSMAAVFEMITE